MQINFRERPDTLEKKLYQLIISRLDGDRIRSIEYREHIFGLVRKGIGGFIIFGGEKAEIKDFINSIQSISEIPLFIASDIERGVGQQIKDTTGFSCPMAIAAAIDKNRTEDIELFEEAIKAIAAEAIDVGINMPLIPVMDVNQNPDNPIICTRAFSDDPDIVSWFGSKYIRIIEDSGLISCAKHFPGHGDTAIDSHIALPVINKSMTDLINADLMPFVQAIKTEVSSIMIGHLTIPALDSKPASLSKNIITNLLREQLGFDGLVLTDALNMSALKDFGNVPVECLNAGVDILLHPVDADLTAQELKQAVEHGDVNENRIDTAISRILNTKIKIQKIKKGPVDYLRNAALSKQIIERSITLIKNKTGILPISESGKVCMVFAGDTKLYGSSPLRNYYSEIQNPNSELLIVAIFTNVAAWKGSSGINETEGFRLSSLIKKARRSIVISFGSPYVLRFFQEADTLIAAYEPAEQAQLAVIKCLQGETAFKGRLPVTLSSSGSHVL